jgi:hypothetical protein
MTNAYQYTSLSTPHFLNYVAIELDILRLICENPDAFDPKGLVGRDEDDQWDIEFDIRVDLQRPAYCEKRLIVIDLMRIWDVKRLILQTLVWPSMFAYAAQIVPKAADILIANGRTQGARALIDAFFDTADNFGLREASSMPMTVRVSDLSTLERKLENGVQALVIGHEIGHYFAHSALLKSVSRDNLELSHDDLELKCDAAGLELSLLFDEMGLFWTVEAGWDGPEPTEHSAIGRVLRVFEHLATAILWGDALCLRSIKCNEGEFDDPFPLARRRTEAMITKFRSSDAGHRYLPFRDLSLIPLEEAFMEIDALVTRMIDLSDDRFRREFSSDRGALPRDHYELEAHWVDRLLSLGLKRSVGDVIVPQLEEHAGMDRWLEVYQDNTMSPPEPIKGPNPPGKELRHRYFGFPPRKD